MRQSSLLLTTMGVFAIACSDERPELDDDFSGDPLAELQPAPALLTPTPSGVPQAEPAAAPAPLPGLSQAQSAEGEVICEVSDPAFRGAKTCLATCEVPCASGSAAAGAASSVFFLSLEAPPPIVFI